MAVWDVARVFCSCIANLQQGLNQYVLCVLCSCMLPEAYTDVLGQCSGIREATLRGRNLKENNLNLDLSCMSVCRPQRNRFIKTGESTVIHLRDSMGGLIAQCSYYLLRNNLHLIIISSDMAWKVELSLVTALT